MLEVQCEQTLPTLREPIALPFGATFSAEVNFVLGKGTSYFLVYRGIQARHILYCAQHFTTKRIKLCPVQKNGSSPLKMFTYYLHSCLEKAASPGLALRQYNSSLCVPGAF